MHALLVSAFLFVDIGIPLTGVGPHASDGPFEITAQLVAGAVRAGAHDTFIVTVRNRSHEDQKLGAFKNGGYRLEGERGGFASWLRNTPIHWRCPPPRTLKPNETTAFPIEVDLTQARSGSAFLSLNFTYEYAEAGHCVAQPFYWLRELTLAR